MICSYAAICFDCKDTNSNRRTLKIACKRLNFNYFKDRLVHFNGTVVLPFELSKTFLYCAMRFGGISKQIAPLANGVNVLHLKPEAMMGIEMAVPSKDLIKHFDVYINHSFNTILHLQDQIRFLTEARDRLLPKLMSGEIAV